MEAHVGGGFGRGPWASVYASSIAEHAVLHQDCAHWQLCGVGGLERRGGDGMDGILSCRGHLLWRSAVAVAKGTAAPLFGAAEVASYGTAWLTAPCCVPKTACCAWERLSRRNARAGVVAWTTVADGSMHDGWLCRVEWELTPARCNTLTTELNGTVFAACHRTYMGRRGPRVCVHDVLHRQASILRLSVSQSVTRRGFL